MRAVVLAAALAALSAGSAQAQEAAGSGATPTVRASLRDGSTVQGFLRGNSADELVIFTRDRSYRHVPLPEVQKLEVRRRTGSHAKRGAVMGVFLWASLMFAASIDRLEDAGPASWESGAILAGSAGLGALIGKGFSRHGWVETEPARLTGAIDPPPARLTHRF
jgi:hypothetical protein